MYKSKLREKSLRSTRPTPVPVSGPTERRFHAALLQVSALTAGRERKWVVDENKGLLLLLVFLFKKHGEKLYLVKRLTQNNFFVIHWGEKKQLYVKLT